MLRQELSSLIDQVYHLTIMFTYNLIAYFTETKLS